jgi:hypothetical protein
LTRSRCRARAATSPSVAADVSVHRTVRHSRVNQAISPQTWTIVHVFHDSSPSIRRSGDRLPGPARLSPRSPLNRPNRTAGALKPPPPHPHVWAARRRTPRMGATPEAHGRENGYRHLDFADCLTAEQNPSAKIAT